MVLLLVFILLLNLIFPSTAMAYLDPGSGSYFLQVVLGLLLGFLFTLKIYWGHIKTYLQKIISKLSNRIKE
ncbi:hypothetical protein A3C32_04345 [Candidatus Daviesbacteria bacterium RIFCSPHIGHO2_02_FULL_41_14]|uniref:Uncharacterized protein n=1 Tax=Candidatus Daviesbacteria bacterium RIFCSPLOWO2_01_FULL_40_24 TaxID=1797787 RepID=A0A1F5MJA5_9BACT|nr:MAG: hypothetical protein A3C32_04345 [Candidatus Daviesbacteria bacterium RIFCSPHIGHO2_02_FULL_41_14]OGE65457.1 MAG: hypothetical protein A3B49_01040 [Candidatus Daviesbacteria bacterium RIFCSPLOWO2_01_FULL_40_24]